MKGLIKLFIVLGIFFTFQSCTQESNDDNPDNLAAPIIPSESLFTIPTQSFGVVGDKESSSSRNSKSNWAHAGLNVLLWNSVVFVNTSVPIAAFRRAFDFKAEYIGNMTWEWNYHYQAPPANGSKKYDVSLTGKLINNKEEVAWTMTVTEEVSGNSFIWYEGVISRDHSSGNFTINKDPQDPKPYMNLSFVKNLDTDDISIKFTNVSTADPGLGDYIEWSTDKDNEYDRAYDVFTKDDLLEIQSNSILKNGKVKHPSHFNDDEWHCWDTNRFNIEC